MRLGGRISAAIDVLDDMEKRHRPAADALRDWGLSHRFAGSGDRAAIGNIVYDALRRKRSAAWLLGDESGRGLAFGALMLESGETPESINRKLDGDRFAPAPLTEAQAARVAENPLAQAPDAVAADVPDWCVPLMERMFGAGWTDEARALAMRPPLDMRVNTLESSRDKVLAELRRSGANPGELVGDALRIPPIQGDGRHPNVQAEPAFQKGWFEIQDEGSQAVALLAGAKPGEQVLDFCAGAGGKTLALSAAMANSGQIYAHDSEKVRLAPIFDRLRRAGSRNVQAVAEADALAPLQGQMDLVLIDAPCTGSGTWRRRPDAKWRLTQRQLDVRRGEQAAILDRAAPFVKLGGRLAYITCSVFADENAEQLEAFLQRAPGFRPVDHAALWREAFPHRPDSAVADRNGICLTPLRSRTDGFYFAMLERTS